MSDSELQEPLLEGLSASTAPSSGTQEQSKKRKRGRGSDKVDATSKPTKSRKTKKQKIQEDDELNTEAGINEAFSHMDSQLLSDYVSQRTRRFESDLSTVELEDRYIPARSIKDTTAFEKPRTIDNLAPYLEAFSPNPTKLWSSSKKNGAPHTIIVAGAGLRAADLARVIRKFQSKDSTVAKLFAKHIKIKDQIAFLKSNRSGMAIGTPARLNELLENDALAVDRLERIVIDASHIDTKKRGVLEMKDTHSPLVQWLNRPEFRERYGIVPGGVDLMFY